MGLGPAPPAPAPWVHGADGWVQLHGEGLKDISEGRHPEAALHVPAVLLQVDVDAVVDEGVVVERAHEEEGGAEDEEALPELHLSHEAQRRCHAVCNRPQAARKGRGGPGKVRDTPVWAVTAGVRRWCGCGCVVVKVTPSAWWWWSWWSLVVVTSRLMLSSRCGYSLELGTCTHGRTARVFVRCSSSSFVDCATKPQ